MKIKFGLSDEEQVFAGGLVRAMIEGQRELEEGVPLCHDPDGTPIYRMLFRGMTWEKIVGGYIAIDGPNRVFNVMRHRHQWDVCLHSPPDIPIETTRKLFSTRREALLHCTHLARRMRWYPGALT